MVEGAASPGNALHSHSGFLPGSGGEWKPSPSQHVRQNMSYIGRTCKILLCCGKEDLGSQVKPSD